MGTLGLKSNRSVSGECLWFAISKRHLLYWNQRATNQNYEVLLSQNHESELTLVLRRKTI